MTHAELLAQVLAECEQLGLLAHHNPDSRRTAGRGFPDVVAVGPGGVIWAELKVGRDTLRLDQRRWGSMLAKSGQRWTVWWPRDLADGTIRQILNSIT